MEIITLNNENLHNEHICCAISNDKDCQVMAKKQWLAQRFKEGLVFKKGDVRGKCFIEYIPAENAWAPINAAGYMYINCFWVSGQYKGMGNSNLLLNKCIEDSVKKGKKGLVILSSDKKMPFLSDIGYLKHKGFLYADSAQPHYRLMYLPFCDNAEKPCFKQHLQCNQHLDDGFVLYYSAQCPFTAKYVPITEALAKAKNVPFKAIKLETAQQAQMAPSPFTSYSLFYNGRFVTNEILSPKKFEKIILQLYGEA